LAGKSLAFIALRLGAARIPPAPGSQEAELKAECNAQDRSFHQTGLARNGMRETVENAGSLVPDL
jgi:hypothetical protein